VRTRQLWMIFRETFSALPTLRWSRFAVLFLHTTRWPSSAWRRSGALRHRRPFQGARVALKSCAQLAAPITAMACSIPGFACRRDGANRKARPLAAGGLRARHVGIGGGMAAPHMWAVMLREPRNHAALVRRMGERWTADAYAGRSPRCCIRPEASRYCRHRVCLRLS